MAHEIAQDETLRRIELGRGIDAAREQSTGAAANGGLDDAGIEMREGRWCGAPAVAQGGGEAVYWQ
jgi:hypothetical protein